MSINISRASVPEYRINQLTKIKRTQPIEKSVDIAIRDAVLETKERLNHCKETSRTRIEQRVHDLRAVLKHFLQSDDEFCGFLGWGNQCLKNEGGGSLYKWGQGISQYDSIMIKRGDDYFIEKIGSCYELFSAQSEKIESPEMTITQGGCQDNLTMELPTYPLIFESIDWHSKSAIAQSSVPLSIPIARPFYSDKEAPLFKCAKENKIYSFSDLTHAWINTSQGRKDWNKLQIGVGIVGVISLGILAGFAIAATGGAAAPPILGAMIGIGIATGAISTGLSVGKMAACDPAGLTHWMCEPGDKINHILKKELKKEESQECLIITEEQKADFNQKKEIYFDFMREGLLGLLANDQQSKSTGWFSWRHVWNGKEFVSKKDIKKLRSKYCSNDVESDIREMIKELNNRGRSGEIKASVGRRMQTGGVLIGTVAKPACTIGGIAAQAAASGTVVLAPVSAAVSTVTSGVEYSKFYFQQARFITQCEKSLELFDRLDENQVVPEVAQLVDRYLVEPFNY